MRLTIILITPARAENIGTAARAMKTMGFTQSRIVDSEAHLKPATRRIAYGSGDIIDSISIFPTSTDALHDIDFTIATTARSRAKLHYYTIPVELVPLLQEKSTWMEHATLMFGREDSGLTNEELALADVLTGVPMVADYPLLSLGQAVMVYYYQLADLIRQSAKSVEVTDELQLQALCVCASCLLTTLNASDGIKLTDWL